MKQICLMMLLNSRLLSKRENHLWVWWFMVLLKQDLIHGINLFISLIFLTFFELVVMQQREKDKERWSKMYYNITDDQKAERNAKKRAKGTVTFSDLVAGVATNEGYRNSWSIIIFSLTYKDLFIKFVYLYKCLCV